MTRRRALALIQAVVSADETVSEAKDVSSIAMSDGALPLVSSSVAVPLATKEKIQSRLLMTTSLRMDWYRPKVLSWSTLPH